MRKALYPNAVSDKGSGYLKGEVLGDIFEYMAKTSAKFLFVATYSQYKTELSGRPLWTWNWSEMCAWLDGKLGGDTFIREGGYENGYTGTLELMPPETLEEVRASFAFASPLVGRVNLDKDKDKLDIDPALGEAVSDLQTLTGWAAFDAFHCWLTGVLQLLRIIHS